MKVSRSRLTAESSAYVFACISQNPLKLFVQSWVLQANPLIITSVDARYREIAWLAIEFSEIAKKWNEWQLFSDY